MAGLVTLKIFNDLSEAEVARSLLDYNGILAFLPDRAVASTVWYLTHAVGGVRLQVPERDLETARSLLGERDDILAEGGVEQCPECGSGDVFRRASLVAGIAAFLLAGMPFFLRRGERYCRQCRHKWRAEPT